MVIKSNRWKIIEKTGGIVQGMSGSPIIQNDKIIGAVTHVLINKPEVWIWNLYRVDVKRCRNYILENKCD